MGATRTTIAIGLGVLLLAAGAGAGAVLTLTDAAEDDDTTPLAVSWSGDEGHPACVYRPRHRTVTATVRVTGDAGDRDSVTITVAAYADENTSRQVGSDTQELAVDGSMDTELDLVMRVRRPPYRDEDGVVACALDSDGAEIAS